MKKNAISDSDLSWPIAWIPCICWVARGGYPKKAKHELHWSTQIQSFHLALWWLNVGFHPFLDEINYPPSEFEWMKRDSHDNPHKDWYILVKECEQLPVNMNVVLSFGGSPGRKPVASRSQPSKSPWRPHSGVMKDGHWTSTRWSLNTIDGGDFPARHVWYVWWHRRVRRYDARRTHQPTAENSWQPLLLAELFLHLWLLGLGTLAKLAPRRILQTSR